MNLYQFSHMCLSFFQNLFLSLLLTVSYVRSMISLEGILALQHCLDVFKSFSNLDLLSVCIHICTSKFVSYLRSILLMSKFG